MQSTTDQALILRIDKLGDHDAIVHFFSCTHGVNRGVVKGGLSRKRRADLQPATLGRAQWKSRLPEHLSSLAIEAEVGFGARVMHDPLALAAVSSAMGLLSVALAERDPHPELFRASVDFLRHVAAGVEPRIWLAEYVRLELALLEQAGFGLDLNCCAATGATSDLVYVSPKSGRAVSRAAGAAYHDKLLALPAFFERGEGGLPDSIAEICDGLALTGYFITERMLPALHRKMPPLRAHFVALVGRMEARASETRSA